MRHWFSDLNAFRRDPLQVLLDKGNAAAEPLVRLNLGPAPMFLVTDPDIIRPLLKANEEDFDKGKLIHKLRSVVGLSSLTMSGDEYVRRREVLHKYMAKGAVERLTTPMAAEIRAVGAQLARKSSFDPHKALAPLALKMVCIAMFGRQVLSEADEQAIVLAVRLVEDDLADELFRVVPLSPWAAYARNQRRAFARKAMNVVVQRVRAHAHDTSILRALETLGLSDEELSSEVLTMLLTGHHTTGSAAAWLLYHMATEPGLADAVAAEASSVTDWNGEIQADRLKNAPLSLALVREILRLYPSAWWFSREVKRPLEFGGRKLKRGTSVIIAPWQLHRDPRFWNEPDSFRLDRSYGSKAYLPFGLGPRTCVGMGLAMLELQLIALELSSAYAFGRVTPHPVPRPSPSVTLIPPAMQIEIRLRESVNVQASAA
ncbi:cytochrome P450 [Microvirga pudoricolor]|uniref:cytochrome P450 n=1 Tax=Microvirga pudoricolor TaxID=2778729 RepID=UPI00194FEDA3|nr:cytochrome P450 [Microvirga pudoricolor]MBM6594589.1 cytochrome P450 [Microvirga pudoricolor]